MPTAALIDRSFHRLAEGLVHLREIPAANSRGTRRDGPDTRLPLVLLHQSPASSRALEPLMLQLAQHLPATRLLAPDSLGNGDSAPPAPDLPDADYFAGSLARLLDVLELDRIDLYGAHTGARIAAEFAVVHPARVRRLVLDGIADYPPELRQRMLAEYAPRMQPDDYGRQLIWAFNFVRDQSLYSPYFLRDAEHRVVATMPAAENLHLRTVDVLKALQTYHKPYLAALRYVARDRLPLITAPTLLLTSPIDSPALKAGATDLVKLIALGRHEDVTAGPAAKAAAIAGFLG